MTYPRHLLSSWRHLSHCLLAFHMLLSYGHLFWAPSTWASCNKQPWYDQEWAEFTANSHFLSFQTSSGSSPVLSLHKFYGSSGAWRAVRQQVCYSLKEHSEKQHFHRAELCFHELKIQGGMHLYKSIFVYIKDTSTRYQFLFKNMLKTTYS